MVDPLTILFNKAMSLTSTKTTLLMSKDPFVTAARDDIAYSMMQVVVDNSNEYCSYLPYIDNLDY